MKEFYEQLGSCLITFIFFACMQSDAKAETPILWPPHVKSLLIGKKLWCWEGLGAGGEGDNRGWDGWMASPTRWTRVWMNSGSWWWTGRPGMLQFIGSQRVGTTEWLNWTEPKGLVLCDSFSPMKWACQAPLSVGFFRQEYWSGLPFPSLGNLLIQGLNLLLPQWQVDSLTLSHQGSFISVTCH